MFWDRFIEVFTIFWFWIGAFISIMILLIGIDTIVSKIRHRNKSEKLNNVKPHKINYDYLEDEDYYGD